MNIDDIVDKQTEWHKQHLQGCIFAAVLLTKPLSASAVEKFCFFDEPTEDLITKLCNIIDSNIQEENNSLVSFIIPSISNRTQLIKFIDLLKLHSNWIISDSELYKGYKLVKIRVPLPEKDENDKIIYSWVLCFAPLDFLPKTRQSPYFELILPTKSKYFLKEKHTKVSLTQHNWDTIDRGGAPHESHLADVYIKGITDDGRKDSSLWKNTSKRKFEILTEDGTKEFDDTMAKAKVTISYPI